MQKNNTTSKTVGIVIIVLIIIIGVWLMTRKSTPNETPMMPAPAATATSTTTGGIPTSGNPAVSSIQTGGNSNADLDSYTAAIDAQMQSLNSDNSAAESATSTVTN